jgi:multidrug resistance efflux pump/beta-lactamase regulating signal transducer with metallopeptidase domain
MITTSLMQSPLWLTAGWVMLHFLWIGAAFGLLAVVVRALTPADPRCRYVAALVCFAILAIAPAGIVLALPPVAAVPLPPPEHASAPLPPEVPLAPEPALPAVERTPFATEALTAAACYLPWLWLIGAPGTFLMALSGLIGSERLRCQSVLLRDGELVERCRRLAVSLGIVRHVAVGMCARLTAPILVGVLRPLILLPPAALGGWSAEQLEMVLLHELAHVRRWDSLINLLQRIVEALLFFHPVVWWLSAWVRLERESCCDQVVIAQTGRRREYAEALASLAQAALPLSPGALAMAEHRLVTRIRRILNLEDRTMKVSTKLLGVALALAVAALVLLGLYAQAGLPDNAGSGPERQAQEVRPSQANQDQVPKAAPTGKTSAPVSARAQVEAYEQVDLYSRVAGTVRTVDAGIGDRVKKGQVLVALDAPDVRLESRQKAALVEQAKAEIQVARSSVRSAEAALIGAKALATEAEAVCKSAAANHTFRSKQAERLKALRDSNAIGQETYDEMHERLEAARAALAAAEAKLHAARAAVEESVARVARAQAGLSVAEARLQAADADAERTRILLDWAEVRAPFDGVVTRRSVDVGAFAPAAGQANAQPLMSVARTDRVRIRVELHEAFIRVIGVGTPAAVRIDAYPDREFEAKVSRIAGSLDRKTRTLRVEIDLSNTDGRLLPGMTGSVTFKAEK